jgi:hypothetical protein
MNLDDSALIDCPYCGETIELQIDASAGDQDYIEDCQVCCRPINVSVRINDDGDIQVRARSDSE